MSLQELFPLIYCTNMDYRPDRWEQAQAEFAKVGITAQRASGEVYTGTSDRRWNGFIGCGLTHLRCLKLALEQDKNILMFEDDVVFINDYPQIISRAVEELPENWDMFYLGGNICRSIFQVSPHLGKLTHAQATHAYGVNKNFLPRVVTELESCKHSRIIDVTYGDSLVPSSNSYITIPMVAVQRDTFSDIEGQYVNYSSWMERRFYEQLIRKD